MMRTKRQLREALVDCREVNARLRDRIAELEPEPEPPPPPSVREYGIAAGGTIQNDAGTTTRELDQIKASGSKWVRVDINGAQILQNGWGLHDRFVQAAKARGLKVLGILTYMPNNATGDTVRFPTLARDAVFRYSANLATGPMNGVQAWEVWNEPNGSWFWNPPSTWDYTACLKATYTAIKQADPKAFVLAGATSPASTSGGNISPIDFLKGVYAAGGKGYFDAWSHHPYCWDQPLTNGGHAWAQMHTLRQLMVDAGDGAKKIWNTEFGGPTGGNDRPITEKQQADMLTSALSLWKSYPWSGHFFWYRHNDYSLAPADSRERHFGLYRLDGSAKPAASVWAANAK